MVVILVSVSYQELEEMGLNMMRLMELKVSSKPFESGKFRRQ